MLRERAVGESLWEAVLPAELRELPVQLAKVDAILDEDRFLAPFRARLSATIGRPTIPIETYLRVMYLMHRYGLGYETLCKEVADSFTRRRFCRIALDGRVPDPSTLMKLTKRLGPGPLEELNAELLSLAVERKALRSRRLRVDTTVVEADIRSPTDSELCAHAVSRLTRLAKRIKAAGLARAEPATRPPPLGRQAGAGDLGGGWTTAPRSSSSSPKGRPTPATARPPPRRWTSKGRIWELRATTRSRGVRDDPAKPGRPRLLRQRHA
jgi:IS5 family transposase